MKGRLIIISSPSGGGKGTLIKEVREMLPELGYSCSHTTRPQRFGEEEGREYFFITEEEFQSRIEAGDIGTLLIRPSIWSWSGPIPSSGEITPPST